MSTTLCRRTWPSACGTGSGRPSSGAGAKRERRPRRPEKRGPGRMGFARTERPIRFGTSGWRGVLADDFTFERAHALVLGVARWLRESAVSRPVFVAHDRRFLGERFARLAAAVLHAEGIRPILVRGAVATPVVSHGVVRTRAAGALIFTASHNPADYQGLKVLGAAGGSLMGGATRRIEELAAQALNEGGAANASLCPVKPWAGDLVERYLADLLQEVDRSALRRAGLAVVYDALHGTGAGVLDAALRCQGLDPPRRPGPDVRGLCAGPGSRATARSRTRRADAGGSAHRPRH